MRSFGLLALPALVISSLLVTQSACDDNPKSAPVSSAAFIVGGNPESGWEGVGALTSAPGGSYWGSFCTGTLIDPSWVLTAAHCIDTYSSSSTYFMVGTDANPDGSGGAVDGVHYATDAAYLHPDYDTELHTNDIGLIHLASPATGVTYYPINTSSMSASMVGDSVLYVGFGATAGAGPSSSDAKRSASIDIAVVGNGLYSGLYYGTGVCFGDSGGPGLLDVTGTGPVSVIGVNSTVGNSGSDPCKGHYNHTRVDQYANWINSYVGPSGPDCNADQDLCFCNSACQSDGTCDNTACQVNTCDDIYSCIVGCSSPGPATGACTAGCMLSATDAAQGQFADLMYDCSHDNCSSSSNWWNCLQTQCTSEMEACFDVQLCDLLGGDCGSSGTCIPKSYQLGDCEPSQGLGLGQECSPGNDDPYDCGDGFVCLVDGTAGAVCHRICDDDSQCTNGPCEKPLFSWFSDEIGYCDDDFSTVDTDADSDSDADGDADSDADSDSDDGTFEGGPIPAGSSDCGCALAGGSAWGQSLLRVLWAVFG